MKLFCCQCCQQILYFENTICEKCGHRLGYIAEAAILSALQAAGDSWRPLAAPGKSFRFCANARHDACNWLVETSSREVYCRSCRHNRTIPDVTRVDNRSAWIKIEMAKRRVFYSLLRFELPMPTRTEDPTRGLAFDFLAEPPYSDGSRVTTGHDNGVITIALAEADDAYRERNRLAMHEPYRTLLGHFRHETGHYFWGRLLHDAGRLESFRMLFGDDRQDYRQALQQYYAHGAAADWQSRFVSMYAASHPWEDFAETWAHYLHIVDTLEIASAFGMSTRPTLTRGIELDATVDFDPYRATSMAQIIDSWHPLSLALNSLNRAMGQSDLYPFVLSAQAIDKLAFVHDLVRAARLSDGHWRP